MQQLVLVLTVLSLPVGAAPTAFVERGVYGSGSANIETTAGGEYVYARPIPDQRMPAGPLLLQTPTRESYAFFSLAEELALLNYRDQQLAARARKRPVAAPGRARRVTRLDWPKVVIVGQQVCVPELASSEAADWRDHLVCHGEGAAR